MSDAWIPCEDIDIASAFGTLGVVMKSVVQVRAADGKEQATCCLAPTSVTRPDLKTGDLLKLLKSGQLEKADPEHPLLYALQGIKNRHAYGAHLKSTERIILITRKGTRRTAYVKESSGDKQLAIADRFLAGHTP